jgi:hypothetical protein
MRKSAQRFRYLARGAARQLMRGKLTAFQEEEIMFTAEAAATGAEIDLIAAPQNADFRTPADPQAGWAARNPDRAMLFLYVTPRDCGALEELMAL